MYTLCLEYLENCLDEILSTSLFTVTMCWSEPVNMLEIFGSHISMFLNIKTDKKKLQKALIAEQFLVLDHQM